MRSRGQGGREFLPTYGVAMLAPTDTVPTFDLATYVGGFG
jgi:hypothetical protein